MIRVFLINLDRSPERLVFMERQAGAIGLRFERIPAIDGTAVPDWLRDDLLTPDGLPREPLVPGEVGCYASHLIVHRRMLDEGLRCALVLEDDTKLSPDLIETAKGVVATAPIDWDYIHLSGGTSRTGPSVAALLNGRHLIRYPRVPLNTGGYLISQSGARKMLASGPRVRPIDQDIRFAWERRLDVLGVYPAPVVCDQPLPTTILAPHRKRHFWSPKLASRLRGHLYMARKMGLWPFLAWRLQQTFRGRRTKRQVQARLG